MKDALADSITWAVGVYISPILDFLFLNTSYVESSHVVTLSPNNVLNSCAPSASNLLPIEENKSPHPDLITPRFNFIASMSLAFAPSLDNCSVNSFIALVFIGPNLTFSISCPVASAVVSIIGSNLFAFLSLDNKTLFICRRSDLRWASTVLSPIALLKNGNNLLICPSNSLTIVSVTFWSEASAPTNFLSCWNASLVCLPLALNGWETHLSNHLLNLPLTTCPALSVFLNFLIATPAPPRAPANKAPSVPNFNLFNNSLPGS